MTKSEAIHTFWNSFTWPAYDEGTVPDDAGFPRITYNVVEDELNRPVALYASLWDRDTSWYDVSTKAAQISSALTKLYPPTIEFEEGRLYLTKGTPYAQRMVDEDDMVRRIYLNITAEYFSAY